MHKKYIEIRGKIIPVKFVDDTWILTADGERLDRATLKAIGYRLIEVPDWEPGTEIHDCDGGMGIYIGPSVDGLRAVLQTPNPVDWHTEFYAVDWCDCGPLSEEEKREAAFEERQS